VRAIGAKGRPVERARVAPARPALEGNGPGFDVLAAVEHVRLADPKLAALITQVGPLRLELKETHSSFAALSEAIVYQQLTGKAAATIFGRFKALYSRRRFPKPGEVLATPDAVLRAAGLSGGKILAIKDLAAKVLSGDVPAVPRLLRMSDDEIVERLTAVRGIGRWTAEMLLIFRLGRPDVLPTDDYGVRKGFAVVFRKRALPSPSDVARHGERWRPYRTAASWYLWRALDRPTPSPSRNAPLGEVGGQKS
jgi:3-methyladenine DNA glycosylase/8-oxoguanine DNA glycosylase